MLKNFEINHTKDSVSVKNNILILISLLHINGFINDSSIKELFKRLRSNKLIRNVKTYHSKINGKWYNDESIFEVYKDIFDSMINPKDKLAILKLERINKLRKINGLESKKFQTSLTFDETLKYLNLFLNRNRNYCIDHLFHEYIKPCIIQYEYKKIELNSIFKFDFSTLENKSDRYDYYCCDYCCGNYDDWLDSSYDRHRDSTVKETQKKIVELISEFLNSKREKYKGSYKEYKL